MFKGGPMPTISQVIDTVIASLQHQQSREQAQVIVLVARYTAQFMAGRRFDRITANLIELAAEDKSSLIQLHRQMFLALIETIPTVEQTREEIAEYVNKHNLNWNSALSEAEFKDYLSTPEIINYRQQLKTQRSK